MIGIATEPRVLLSRETARRRWKGVWARVSCIRPKDEEDSDGNGRQDVPAGTRGEEAEFEFAGEK